MTFIITASVLWTASSPANEGSRKGIGPGTTLYLQNSFCRLNELCKRTFNCVRGRMLMIYVPGFHPRPWPDAAEATATDTTLFILCLSQVSHRGPIKSSYSVPISVKLAKIPYHGKRGLWPQWGPFRLHFLFLFESSTTSFLLFFFFFPFLFLFFFQLVYLYDPFYLIGLFC